MNPRNLPAFAVLILVGACGLAPPPGSQRPADVVPCYPALSDSLPATRQFNGTFAAGDLEARAAAIAALQAAAQTHPQEEEVAVLLGLAQLWRVAEPRAAEVNDGLGLIFAALSARSELERARMLCPSDHRLAAWLGPILVNMGRNLMDQATVDRGMAVLLEGIDHYPAFVLFSRLLVFADRPRADPDFQTALQAVLDNSAACGDPATSTDPACINSPRAVHNIEGASVFLGDVYAKAGRRDDALRVYEAARGGPGHGSWPYQQVLKDRIATLDARVAAFADMDGKNDPESAWNARNQCSLCHKR